MKREDGILLQAHGARLETRAHWYFDDGGGEWLRFLHWQEWQGHWTQRETEDLSSIALETLRELLNKRAEITSTGSEEGK